MLGSGGIEKPGTDRIEFHDYIKAILRPIHPFPARMAPELVLRECGALAPGSVVLDPMAGSGTVLRVAAEYGHEALGFDLDPLAVIMARVWTTPIDTRCLKEAAVELARAAQEGAGRKVSLPWIDDDDETRRFVDYWFAREQQLQLRILSSEITRIDGPHGDALRVALSRIIVTKDKGASLGRDVSHSRPHRVAVHNDFPVADEFLRAATRLAWQLEKQRPPGRVTVRFGDARKLESVAEQSIDAVITSPPYLNAIDYLRGHRLSLVWLGYRLADLRRIRGVAIGAERAPEPSADLQLANDLISSLHGIARLPQRQHRMIQRYALDLYDMVSETYRVLRPGGKAVFVIGNSCLRGVFVKNASLLIAAAERAGLRLVDEFERELPPNRRYLPPPEATRIAGLRKRMRTESVLTFVRT